MGKKKTAERKVAEPKAEPKAEIKSDSKMFDVNDMIGVSQRFAVLNKLITRDLKQSTTSSSFSKYTKDNITTYLQNPDTNQSALRKAISYIYSASPHFRRLIQYFVGLSDLAYVVSPYRIDPKTSNPKSINRNYRKTLNFMSAMNVQVQLPKVLTTCLKEDVSYITMWVSNDNVTLQMLPPDYCKISSIEGNVLNTAFDFSYFDSDNTKLNFYPPEFKSKYNKYQGDRTLRWQELDSPTSFAIKCSTDILEYPLPPFAGILREVYDLEDYKALKLSKTALENYAMIVMTIGLNEDGDWQIDLNKAREFWRNLDSVLPEEIGSVLTPLPISKISFEKSHTADTNTIADAEQNLFSAAGVSSLLFNNNKASANALNLSIKADQAITFGIVKSIECAINRYIQSQSYGKNFKVTFIDSSPFNRKEMSDAYLKACQYGIPMISYYAATQGLNQSELDCMSFLENDVLGLTEMFKPLRSSSTMSSSDGDESTTNEDGKEAATDEGGAPRKEGEDLSEGGERHREDE